MVAKCSNHSCARSTFSIESDSGLPKAGLVNGLEYEGTFCHLQQVWLCARCSKAMTLRVEKEQVSVVYSHVNRRSRDLASCLRTLVLQVVDRTYQLSHRTRQDGIFSSLKFIAHSVSAALRESRFVENSFAAARISSKYFGSTIRSYSRQVSSIVSTTPAR